MQSDDKGHFFQTSASLTNDARKARKAKNKSGSPIVLKGKILALLVDPTDSACVYTAESGGVISHVNMTTGKTVRAFRGPQAPLTSLAISSDGSTLYAGCWDKTVWTWALHDRTGSLNNGKQVDTQHEDFVKCLLCQRIPGTAADLLIIGTSDGLITLRSPGATANDLILNNAHSGDINLPARGILCLAIDPSSHQASHDILIPSSQTHSFILFVSSSDPFIRRWKITLTLCNSNASTSPVTSIQATPHASAISVHETSINHIFFHTPSSTLIPELWTASSDGTAKRLRSNSTTDEWTANLILQHGDYVRSVHISPSESWVITTGRDENVKIWDRDDGTGTKCDSVKTPFHIYEGHFDEVTSCALGRGNTVYTGSIDCTLRSWVLDEESMLKDEAVGLETGEEEEAAASLLTEEEERELAELMSDDD